MNTTYIYFLSLLTLIPLLSMIKFPCLLAITISTIAFSACNKSATSSPNKELEKATASDGPYFSIPITMEQASVLNSLMKQNKITGPADLRKKTDSLKLVMPNSISLKNITRNNTTLDNDDDGGSLDIALTSSAALTEPDGNIEMYFGKKLLKAAYRSDILTYSFRGNKIQILVPYQYYCVPTLGGYNAIERVEGAGYAVQILPIGAYWGEVTQGTTWHVNGGINSTPKNDCEIEAFGTAEEKRTRIISTSGMVKISTNVNLEVFQAGVEIEQGFTIQTAYNIYNQYEAHVNGTITVSDGYWLPGDIPSATFQGTTYGLQWGISQNQ